MCIVFSTKVHTGPQVAEVAEDPAMAGRLLVDIMNEPDNFSLRCAPRAENPFAVSWRVAMACTALAAAVAGSAVGAVCMLQDLRHMAQQWQPGSG